MQSEKNSKDTIGIIITCNINFFNLNYKNILNIFLKQNIDEDKFIFERKKYFLIINVIFLTTNSKNENSDNNNESIKIIQKINELYDSIKINKINIDKTNDKTSSYNEIANFLDQNMKCIYTDVMSIYHPLFFDL